MPVIYSAVQRFDPACGDKWTKFIGWCGLTQLREVISLDGILCPSVIVIDELTVEDWQHNVPADFQTSLFHDLDYVLNKVAGNESVNILALIQEPTTVELASFDDPRFIFRGFDLVERSGEVSALVNCGGDLRVIGTPPDDDVWHVAIEDPQRRDVHLAMVDLLDGGVATSTSLRRRWTADDGTVLHHLIDPATGLPAHRPWTQVTVVAGSAWWAEVLTKVVFLDGELDDPTASALVLDDDASVRVLGQESWFALTAEAAR
jgi:hypothetical protein